MPHRSFYSVTEDSLEISQLDSLVDAAKAWALNRQRRSVYLVCANVVVQKSGSTEIQQVTRAQLEAALLV